MLNNAAQRVETIRRWREMLADCVGKDAEALKARAELERQMDEAYAVAIMDRTREDLARAQAVST